MSNEEAYKFEEDSDFVGGSISVDGDDNMYEADVECVESEFEAIDAANIIETSRKETEGEHVDAAVEGEHVDAAVEGEHVDATAEGEHVDEGMDGNKDSDIESFEDLNYCIGHEVTDSDDDVEDEQTEESHIVSEAAKTPFGQNENVDDNSESESGSEDSDVDVVDCTRIFDEGRVSDEENEQYPRFNPQEKYKPEFVIKQVFATKKEFKFAVQSHAIKCRRNIKFTCNDLRRMYARCLSSECKWMINALRMKNDTSFQIRKFLDHHTCAPSHKVKSLTSSWLSERFLQRFQSDGGRSVKGFRMDAMHDVRCEISKTQAYKAKKKALLKIEGDPDAQYTKLWSYVDELRKTNPGSTVLLGTESETGVARFSRFYSCLYALKAGFLSGCRKILGVDGCFLKGKYGGMLLTAVGVDGNKNHFPVAYAVVERESQDEWEWFLHILKQDLQINAADFTFISNKQKGLIGAMEVIFPGVNHRFCVRHLHNNLKVAGFRGVSYKLALWKAACSTSEGMFKNAMKEMKELSQGAWEWFQNKPPHQWCKAYFNEKAKCDMLLNNVCETFNANILEARDKSIITMLEWIRESLMVKLQKNRDRAMKKWKGILCPRIQKILDIQTEKVVDCIPVKGSDYHYQIACFDGTQFTVDLKKLECSCRSWQLTGIPCTHAICALLRQNLNPLDFVDECYHVQTYNKSYKNTVYGISYDLLWGDSMYIPPLPPSFGKRAARGRNPKQRRKEPFEKSEKNSKKKLQTMKRQTLSYKCKKCGGEGHNTITCGRKPVKPKAPVGKERRSVNQGTTSNTPTGENHIAPPMRTSAQDINVSDLDVGLSTQQSQVTTQTLVDGPSIHEQIQDARRNFRI